MTAEKFDNMLNDLLATSLSMQACAKNGEWEQVAELDIERRRLLASLIREPASDIDNLNQIMKEIFSINKAVIDLASEARNATAKGQLALVGQRHHCNTYQQTQNASLEE